MPDADEIERDEIKAILALILSNQALIMTALACLPGVPSAGAALNRAGELTLSKGREIEQGVRAKYGFKRSVS